MGSSFFFPRGQRWWGVFCLFVPNVFSSCSHGLPQAPKLFPKTFPITPQFYPKWFAQSSILMYINWKSGPKGSTFVSFSNWDPKRCFYWGAPNVPKTIGDGPNNMHPQKKKKKKDVNAPMNKLIWITICSFLGVLFLFSQFLLVQSLP
jgi:hypothetical protein